MGLGVAVTSGVAVPVGEGPAVGVATIIASECGSGTTRGTRVVVMVEMTVGRWIPNSTLRGVKAKSTPPRTVPGGSLVGVGCA